MRPRTTVVLVALAALAVGTIWLFERDLPGTDERRELEGRLFPLLEESDVDRLVIDRPGEDTIELVREDGGWRLERPVRDRADAGRVGDLLRLLAEARVESRVPAGEIVDGVSATGLHEDAPRVAMTADGVVRELVIGQREVPGGLRFVRTAGDELALVRSSLLDALPSGSDALRDRALTTLASVDLDRVEIDRDGSGRLVLARRDPETDGSWWIEQPFRDLAVASAANALVRAVTSLRAETILDTLESEDVDAAPGWTITLVGAAPAGANAEDGADGETGAEEPARLIVRVGGLVPGTPLRFATVSDRAAVFEIEADALIAELEAPAAALRSMSALDESAWDVASVTLRRGGSTARVERVDGEFEIDAKWRLVEPEGAAFDAAAFDALLGSLVRIDAVRVEDDADLAATGLDAPVASLALVLRGGEEVRLDVGASAPGDAVYARRSGRPATLVIAAADAARIDPSELAHDVPSASATGAAENGSP